MLKQNSSKLTNALFIIRMYLTVTMNMILHNNENDSEHLADKEPHICYGSL